MLLHFKVLNFNYFESAKKAKREFVWQVEERVISVFHFSLPMYENGKYWSDKCCVILKYSTAGILNPLNCKGDSVRRIKEKP